MSRGLFQFSSVDMKSDTICAGLIVRRTDESEMVGREGACRAQALLLPMPALVEPRLRIRGSGAESADADRWEPSERPTGS